MNIIREVEAPDWGEHDFYIDGDATRARAALTDAGYLACIATASDQAVTIAIDPGYKLGLDRARTIINLVN